MQWELHEMYISHHLHRMCGGTQVGIRLLLQKYKSLKNSTEQEGSKEGVQILRQKLTQANTISQNKVFALT